MTETFIRIASGHYRNVGTGVEIVKVSADEAGQRGWHVTTPTVSGFEVVAIGATMREVKDAYAKAVREAYAAIEQSREEAAAGDRLRVADMAADASMAVVRDNDYAEALAYAEVIHHVTRYSCEISCGETGRVRVTEVAREVTCTACVAADDARRMAIAEEQAYADDRDRRDAEIEADEAWAASDTTWRQTTEQAHAEALAIDADRTNFLAEQGDTEDDDLIHLWPGDRSPSACGADIWTTPYTYGSPVLAEVTCDDCKGREQHRQFVARVREHRTANGGGLIENRRMVIDNDHAEALTMNGESVWFEGRTWTVEHVVIGEGGRACLTLENDDDPATGRVRNVYVDDVIADNHEEALREQAKRDAARIIAGARARFILCTLHGSDCRASQNGRPCSGMPKVEWTYKPIAPGTPEVPADLDDDAASDQQIADVLAEYGDPYAALRAEVVGHYKDTARMAWKIRTREYDDTLKQDLLSQLRATMRTLRGVVETYDMLTESWRLSVRAGTERDAATQTF